MALARTLADVDLTPTPEMQQAAKAGLKKLGSSDSAVPKGMIDRAKRISRGVPLEEHHVHGIAREHARMLAGTTVGGNLAADAHAQQDTEHLLRGGSAGADWAQEKVEELASIRQPSAGSEAGDGDGDADDGSGVKASAMPLIGLPLDEARRRRHGMALALDYEARDATFEAADSVRRCARALSSLAPDDSPIVAATKLASASSNIGAALQQLPSGHPMRDRVGAAVTAVENVTGYPIDGLDHTIDSLANRLLELDPDRDGDNDLGPDDEEDGPPLTDASLEPLEDKAQLGEYLSEGTTLADLNGDTEKLVGLADAVRCPECSRLSSPESGRCKRCGSPLARATGGMEAGEDGDLDVAATWSDAAREAAAAVKRAHHSIGYGDESGAKNHLREALNKLPEGHAARPHIDAASKAVSADPYAAIKHMKAASSHLESDDYHKAAGAAGVTSVGSGSFDQHLATLKSMHAAHQKGDFEEGRRLQVSLDPSLEGKGKPNRSGTTSDPAKLHEAIDHMGVDGPGSMHEVARAAEGLSGGLEQHPASLEGADTFHLHNMSHADHAQLMQNLGGHTPTFLELHHDPEQQRTEVWSD